MFPLRQSMLISSAYWLIGQPANPRLIAFILLIAFFVLTIALVPTEFRSLQSAPRRMLPLLVLFEISVFCLVVITLLGFIFDWFLGRSGAILAVFLVSLVWVAAAVFFILRIVLAFKLYLDAKATARSAAKALASLSHPALTNKQRQSSSLENNETKGVDVPEKKENTSDSKGK